MRYEGYRLGIVLVSTAKKIFKEARAEDDVVFWVLSWVIKLNGRNAFINYSILQI